MWTQGKTVISVSMNLSVLEREKSQKLKDTRGNSGAKRNGHTLKHVCAGFPTAC